MIENPNKSISSPRIPTLAVSSAVITPSNLKFSSLKSLQEQYRKNNAKPQETISISTELLELSKQEFLSILESKKDPAFLAFQQIQISHKQNNQVELLTDTLFNKHFLDAVKDEFHTLLEHRFKQSIILSIQIDESLQTENVSYKNIKSQVQIFDELAYQYPLLKVMKEKLDLRVD